MVAPLRLPTYLAQRIKPNVVHSNELHQAHALVPESSAATYLAESYEPPQDHHGEQRPLTLACHIHKLEIHASLPTSVVLPWFQWLQTTRHSDQCLQPVQHQPWLHDLHPVSHPVKTFLMPNQLEMWSSINLHPLRYFLGLRPLHLLRDGGLQH